MIRVITKKKLEKYKQIEEHSKNLVFEIDNVSPCGVMYHISLQKLRKLLWK